MNYDVTVATKEKAVTSSAQASPQKVSGASASTKLEGTSVLSVVLPVVVGLSVVGTVVWFVKKR